MCSAMPRVPASFWTNIFVAKSFRHSQFEGLIKNAQPNRLIFCSSGWYLLAHLRQQQDNKVELVKHNILMALQFVWRYWGLDNLLDREHWKHFFLPLITLYCARSWATFVLKLRWKNGYRTCIALCLIFQCINCPMDHCTITACHVMMGLLETSLKFTPSDWNGFQQCIYSQKTPFVEQLYIIITFLDVRNAHDNKWSFCEGNAL